MPGQHKGNCFPEDRPGYAFLRRMAPQLTHTSYLMIGSGQETGVIVVGKLIHRHLIGLSIEGRRLILQQVQEKVRIVHKADALDELLDAPRLDRKKLKKAASSIWLMCNREV